MSMAGVRVCNNVLSQSSSNQPHLLKVALPREDNLLKTDSQDGED